MSIHHECSYCGESYPDGHICGCSSEASVQSLRDCVDSLTEDNEALDQALNDLNVGLVEKEKKLAMYEAATKVGFGRQSAAQADGLVSSGERSWIVIDWESNGLGIEPNLTRDEAIAKAYELSKGGK